MIDTIRMILDQHTFTVIKHQNFGIQSQYALGKLLKTKREIFTWKEFIKKEEPKEEVYEANDGFALSSEGDIDECTDANCEDDEEEKEKQPKQYRPKVFLLNTFGKLELILEFSVPKLMFGNNLRNVLALIYHS